MPTALFLSPHLDDVVFSCGGLACLLAAAGWRTVLVTAFTRSVVPATGFALECQLDKGLPPDADYMALRRDEDRRAAQIIGFDEVRWLDLAEAPHRGYHSAPALFGAVRADDRVALPLTAAFVALAAELRPEFVASPQGLGNHVDHQQVAAAAIGCFAAEVSGFYRDTPYAIRNPAASALPGVSTALATFDIGAALDRKIAAAQAYDSQIGFQFGGPQPLAAALREFALKEGNGATAERLSGAAALTLTVRPAG